MKASGARWSGVLLVSLAFGSCRCNSGLAPTRASVSVVPSTLDFGNVYVRATPQRSVTALNGGEGEETLTVSWLTDGGTPFSSDAGVLSLPGGASLQIPFTFAPVQPGQATATVQVGWSEGTAGVTLTGNALAWPPCAPQGPCSTAAFDPDTGACNQQPLADGRACDGGDVCLINTVCAAGQCLGQLNTCDDGDACTLNYCIPGEGCHSQDQSGMCQGTDPCQIYSCDPKTGCQSAQAPDGTPCGSTETCQTATFCLKGTCTGVPVPNGTPCALWWAPCVDDATCSGGTCDSPTADAWKPGQELWEWVDAGYMVGRENQATPVAVDSAGTTYLPYESKDGTFTLRWIAIDTCGRTRWDVPWGSLGNINYEGTAPSLAGGQLIAWTGKDVAGLLPASGAVLWQTDLTEMAAGALGLPDGSYLETGSAAYTNQGLLLFTGNYDYQSHDLLMALSVSGAPVWAQQIPFDSSGLVVDSAGNAYFSGSLEAPAPYPDGGAWFASIDSTGNLRFAMDSNAGSPQAVGPNDVVTLQSTSPYYYDATITIFGFDGVELNQPVEVPMDLLGTALGEVIDASGTVYVAGSGDPDGGAWFGTLVAIKTSGSIAWMATLPDGDLPTSMPALGDGNTLFLAAVTQSPGNEDALLAFDTTGGSLLWKADLGPDPNYGLADFQSAVLALTNTGLLLVSNVSGLSAYFAGPHQPPPNAPWPRQGGDNTNRYCPPATVGP